MLDPLYTAPFLVCLIIAAFYNYKGRNGPAYRQVGKRINNLGIYLSSSYLVVTLLLKWAAHTRITAALENKNIAYSQVSTRPAPLNTVVWNANVDAGDHYLIGDYSFFDTQEPTFKAYPKRREASRRIDKTQGVQRLITISEGWYITSQEKGQWYFNDLRFGLIPIDPENPQFIFRYQLEEQDGDVIATEDRPQTENTAVVFETLWERVKGN